MAEPGPWGWPGDRKRNCSPIWSCAGRIFWSRWSPKPPWGRRSRSQSRSRPRSSGGAPRSGGPARSSDFPRGVQGIPADRSTHIHKSIACLKDGFHEGGLLRLEILEFLGKIAGRIHIDPEPSFLDELLRLAAQEFLQPEIEILDPGNARKSLAPHDAAQAPIHLSQ